MSRGAGFARLCNAGFKREVIGLCVTCKYFSMPKNDYAYPMCQAYQKWLSEPGQAQPRPRCEAYLASEDTELLTLRLIWVKSLDADRHVFTEIERQQEWYKELRAASEAMQDVRRTALTVALEQRGQ